MSQDQDAKGPNQRGIRTVVEVSLNKGALLPCQCTKWNLERPLKPQWIDNHGRLVNLFNTSHPKKYTLVNDEKRNVVEGDCSLYVRSIKLDDQGEYKCMYVDLTPEGIKLPEKLSTVVKLVRLVAVNQSTIIKQKVFEEMITVETEISVPSSTEGTRTHQTTSKWENIGSTITSVEMIKKVLTQSNLEFVSEEMKTAVVVAETVTTSVVEGESMSTNENSWLQENVGVTSAYNDEGEVSEFESFDQKKVPEEVKDEWHTICRREAKWKAFGFDSSALQITDPWAKMGWSGDAR